MATSGNKTQANDGPVEEYLAKITDERRRRQAGELAELMADVTGEPAVMWGSSIVGFGAYQYRYESGREGEFMLVGFSNRKASLTLYITGGFDGFEPLLADLGPHTTGKSCLYVKDLDALDQQVLRQLIDESVTHMRSTHPTS